MEDQNLRQIPWPDRGKFRRALDIFKDQRALRSRLRTKFMQKEETVADNGQSEVCKCFFFPLHTHTHMLLNEANFARL